MRRVVVGACLLAAAPDLGAQVPALAVGSATVRTYDGRVLPAAQLRLRVPLRRDGPGDSITVAALRLPSTATRPGDPIVFLMGGPGIPGSVMVPIPPYADLFTRLRGLADVIVVDQRGIGRSTPVLECQPGDGPMPGAAFTAPQTLVGHLALDVNRCAAAWFARGVEATAFTTLAAAADLEDLRRALGVERFDLLAFSYGTRLALAYLQQYPTRVGRLVLQGVNGPGQVLKHPVAHRRKLVRLGELVARDSAWRGPTDLVAAALAARERLARQATRVRLSDRRTDDTIELGVGRAGLDAIVALNLDDVRLPALLTSVAAGDDRLLARFVEAAWNGLQGGPVGLMARATNCAADRPASRRRAIERAARQAPFGEPMDNAFLTDEYCRMLGYTSPAVEFSGPVRSAVPALLLTGTLDATNPSENAREVARGLPGAVVIDVEDGVHEMLPAEPVQDVIVDFLGGADVRGRRVAVTPQRFPDLEAALRPAQRRGP